MKFAKDPQTMETLKQEVIKRNGEFQANLVAITKAEAKVEKVHRTIDTEESQTAAAPEPKAPTPPPQTEASDSTAQPGN